MPVAEIAAVALLGDVGAGYNADDIGHGLRLGGVDAQYVGVRMRACDKASVAHAVGLDVAGIYGRAGDLFNSVVALLACAYDLVISHC